MITIPHPDAAVKHSVPTWRETTSLKPLWLTREEAMRLLEISVASTADLDGMEECALHKLGDLCRAFLREEAAA